MVLEQTFEVVPPIEVLQEVLKQDEQEPYHRIIWRLRQLHLYLNVCHLRYLLLLHHHVDSNCQNRDHWVEEEKELVVAF